MVILISILLSFFGTVLLYMSLPNQRWRQRPLTRPWQGGAVTLLLLSWPAWMNSLEPAAGFFAALILVMLLLGLLPLLSLLRREQRR